MSLDLTEERKEEKEDTLARLIGSIYNVLGLINGECVDDESSINKIKELSKSVGSLAFAYKNIMGDDIFD